MPKKKYREAECVYCGEVGRCTEEHVIPQCLFAESDMPLNSEFLIVPACRTCNERKAKDDAYLRDSLPMDITTNQSPKARAIIPKFHSSLRKNWSDFGRAALKETTFEPVSTPSGVYIGHYPVAPLDWKRYRRFFTWVTRGIYWKEYGQRIPDNFEFRVLRLDAREAEESFYTIAQLGNIQPKFIGKGVFGYIHMRSETHPFVTQWLYSMFESVNFTVFTIPPNFANDFR